MEKTFDENHVCGGMEAEDHNRCWGGKFLDEGALMPESGIKDLGRWHDIAGKRVFTLVETEDTAVLHAWLSLWAEYFNWSVYPVLEDDECGAVISNLLGR